MSNTTFIEVNESLPDGSTRIIATSTDNVSIKVRTDQIYPPGTTVERLKQSLNGSINGAVSSDELKKLPLNTPIDLSPQVITPSPDEQARIDYNNALFYLSRATGWLNLGVFDNTLPEYQALLTNAQKKFKPEYLNT